MGNINAEIKLGLLENGLDFIVNSLGSILNDYKETEFKYSILHIVDGTELIIKEILKNEHWSLLFENLDKANRESLENGDFSSVKFDSSIERLENICNIKLEPKEKSILYQLRKRRNKIQHFEFKENKESIKSLIANALIFLLKLINQNINIDESSIESQMLYKELSKKSNEFEIFTQHVLKKHKEQLDAYGKEGKMILNCPKCFQQTFIIANEEDPKCLFCGYSDSSEIAARQYVENILDINKYIEVKDGGYFPVEECPNCNKNSLVLNKNWTCFNCGESWKQCEIGFCIECNDVFPLSNLEFEMCENCYNSKLDRFGES